MADDGTRMAASVDEEQQQQQQPVEGLGDDSPAAASSGVGGAHHARTEQITQEEPGSGSNTATGREANMPLEIGGSSSGAPIAGGVASATLRKDGLEGEGGSSSSAKPATRVQIASGGTGEVIGATSGGQQSAKKARDEAGSSERGAVLKKARSEIDAPISSSEPACAICGKKFATWKGVFGHLRAHPDRQWRGAFPPPIGKWSRQKSAPSSTPTTAGEHDQQGKILELEEQLAPALLSIAKQTLEIMQEDTRETAASSSSPVAGPSRRSHYIDLNVNPEPSNPSSSPSPPEIKEEKGFDLNLPPPDESGGSGSEASA